MDILDVIARPLLYVLRGALWLVWEAFVLTVAWWVGWPVWRLLTLGRFPHAGFNGDDEAGTRELVLVCTVGLALIGSVTWCVYAVGSPA